MYKSRNVQLKKCVNQEMFRSRNVQIKKCTDQEMCRSRNVQLEKCVDQEMCRSRNVQIKQCVDQEMCSSRNVQIKKCVDQEMCRLTIQEKFYRLQFIVNCIPNLQFLSQFRCFLVNLDDSEYFSYKRNVKRGNFPEKV